MISVQSGILRRWHHLKFSKLQKVLAISYITTIIFIVLHSLTNPEINHSKIKLPQKNSPTLFIISERQERLTCTSRVKMQLSSSEKAYQRYVQKRNEKDGWYSPTIYYDFFLPSFSCPHTVQRIGQLGDGGKWTCGFDLYERLDAFGKTIKEPCIVYSFGIFGNSTYEEEFINRTSCEVFAYDGSMNGMGPQISHGESRIHFQKSFLGKETTGHSKTLGTIMREKDHFWIDFLKIDIERGELNVLNQILDEFEILPFGQLQLGIQAETRTTRFPVFSKIWKRMEQQGLRSFKNEVNHGRCIGKKEKPTVFQYGFINIVGGHRILRDIIDIPDSKRQERPTCPSQLKMQLASSEKAYQRYVAKRKEKVGSNPKTVNPWNTETIYYDFFLPSFSCPHTVQRIGQIGDGGKWTCGFDLYETLDNSASTQQEPCVVYSFGVFEDSTYEAEFISRTDCKVFAYDASVDGIGKQISNSQSRIHFQPTFLANETTGNRKTLKAIMTENGHFWIDFLKIDIEGDEYDVLNQILDEFEILPFGHLQIEIHADQEGILFSTFYKIWERMEQKGLRSFQNEENAGPCVGAKKRPSVFEYSFINILGEHRLVQ